MLRRRNGGLTPTTAVLLSVALGVVWLPAGTVNAAPATAAAAPTYALSLSEVVPVNGYSHPVVSSSSSLDVSARLNNSPEISSLNPLYIEVASQNVRGQDGTLSNDYQVKFSPAYATDTDPSVFKGRLDYMHLLASGTYYWQFNSGCIVSSPSGSTFSICMSPVYTLTVTRPVTPTPTPTPPLVKASTRISLAKSAWSTNGWKATATLLRDGAPSAQMKLVGQWRTNGSWRKDKAWRTNRYGKVRVLFDGETMPTQYRFVFKGDDSTEPSNSKAFSITRRR